MWCSVIRVVIAVSVSFVALSGSLSGQSVDREAAVAAMRKAATFYREKVAVHGGYVYHYSIDLNQRWGEGLASKDQIWVQPPGTPTVGMAYLRAFEATGDKFYLDAATEAAQALVYGQLKSGGWTNAIDFDPTSPNVAEYRNGKGKGKNNSSLDDGQTASAIQFLVQADKALGFRNQEVHESAITALDALLAAQYPNGGFPQVWTRPVPPQPIIAASYPDYDWRTEGRVKNYWDMYTLNDNVTGYVAATLVEAHRVYSDNRYLESLKRLGDFLLLSQMPEPQPGWAQQYSYDMKPIWARKFEPPGVSGDETQEVIATLMLISEITRDPKFFEPIPRAAAWLKRSLLADGKLARYYELKTNRPLYMTRQGEKYELTYDDSNLPDHYGWKTESKLAELGRQFALARTGKPNSVDESHGELSTLASGIVKALDASGRWIDRFDGQRLVGQAKLSIDQEYLSSQTFSDNLILLSKYVQSQPR
jgi:PelA/Pel-15E family pectate lyase